MEEQFDGACSIIEFFESEPLVNTRLTSRAYRNQAIVLIGICRFFSQFSAHSQEQDTELKTIIRSCDEVLRFATRLGQRVTYKATKRFEYAIETLSAYASIFHPGVDLVRARMAVAKRKDATEALSYQVSKPPDLRVNFVLFKTLPDPEPVVVQMTLSPTANIEEVLWEFAHFGDNRRISLQDNPHFYLDLPTSSDAYTGKFKARPLKNIELRQNATVYVLVDQLRRVVLETRPETRIFGNVFILKDAMIFKDVHGVLEGESVVGESVLSIRNLWSSEKFFVITDSSIPAYDFSLSPIITANTTAKRTIRDRIGLVRRALSSGYYELHIYVGQLPPSWVLRDTVLFPLAPTSERPGYDLLYTTADMLHGNILLTIFDYCRLDDEECWNLQLRWCKLSHVCRKWRNVIHRSSLYLAMHIPFTDGAPPLDVLSRLPPLPMVADFRSSNATEIDDCVLHAMLQRGRICPTVLHAPLASSEDFIVLMDEPFPILEYLSLSSSLRPKKDTKLMIPGTFLALNLRRLTSHGTFLLKGIQFLASSVSLVTLKLTDVKTPCYFTLEGLITLLQHVPELEELSVDFSIPTPRTHAEGQLLRPTIPLATLPALRRLDFCGARTYLESFLSRISAPLLQRLDIALSDELTTSSRLSHFTETLKGLRHRPIARIHLNRRSVSFVVRSGGEHSLSLHLSCNHFDSLIRSVTHVYSALVPVLSFAKELTLKFEDQDLPPDWQDEVDGIAWHDLLGPSSSVKRLYVGHPFATGFSGAMRSGDTELVLGLLPKLQELEAELEVTQANTAFAAFVHARQLAGRPVRLSVTRIYPTLQTVPFPTWTFQKRVRLSSAPTSERPECDLLYTAADTLRDNILLTIFDYCRLDDEEGWNLQLRWCKLSHVCRKWRYIIHQSAFQLDIHVTLTNSTLPLETLSHLPPVPIVIDYRRGDVAETLHAIQQCDGIRRIVLQAPSPTSEKLIVPMDTPFPTLEHLSFSSMTRPEEGAQLMIPGTSIPPNLRRLTTRRTSLPKGLPLLVSNVLLVSLRLTDIQTSGYFTPKDLVAQLEHTPQLEELSIGFSIPMPCPNAEGESLQPPIPLATLPTLKRLVFRGIDAYLESLLAQINAPILEGFDVTLFDQLTFSLQHLSHLTKNTESFRHPIASVTFDREGVSFVIGPRAKLGDGSFSLQVRCQQFDWQTTVVTHVCGALEPVLSVAEVTLELGALPPDWRNAIDGKVWHELLGPFNNAKQLRIVCPHAPEISSVLESYRAGATPGHLSPSQPPDAHVKSGHENESAIVIDIPPSDRPVKLPLPHTQHSQSTESFVVIEAYSIPVADSSPEKRNWFRRTVVDRVWRRLGSLLCTRG